MRGYITCGLLKCMFSTFQIQEGSINYGCYFLDELLCGQRE